MCNKFYGFLSKKNKQKQTAFFNSVGVQYPLKLKSFKHL